MALRVIDSLALRYEPLILLLGRVCIGSLYLMSGTNHWWDQTLLTHFMTGLPGSVHVWAILAATIEVVSGAAIILGFRTRDFALLLVLFNLCAAVIGHPYWSIPATSPHAGPSSSISGKTSDSRAAPSSSSREAPDP